MGQLAARAHPLGEQAQLRLPADQIGGGEQGVGVGDERLRRGGDVEVAVQLASRARPRDAAPAR
ncbi:MAG: hypothetical protein IPK19_24855 [Chloroflexi bacterium]|nr:hypothetical protein [Chloroflexota bacterium]